MSYNTLNEARRAETECNEKLIQAKYTYERELRRTFREEANVLFHDHSDLKEFSWTQATDPELNYEFFDDKIDVKVNGLGYDALKSLPIYYAYKDVAEFLEEFTGTDLLTLFGDHVRVKVTPHGIDVSFFDVEEIVAK